MNSTKRGITLKKVWKNKKKIIEGVKNRIIKNDSVEKIAKERMAICNKCEFKVFDTDLKQDCCSICGCILELKTRSMSSNCGLEEDGKTPKWNSVPELEDFDDKLMNI